MRTHSKQIYWSLVGNKIISEQNTRRTPRVPSVRNVRSEHPHVSSNICPSSVVSGYARDGWELEKVVNGLRRKRRKEINRNAKKTTALLHCVSGMLDEQRTHQRQSVRLIIIVIDGCHWLPLDQFTSIFLADRTLRALNLWWLEWPDLCWPVIHKSKHFYWFVGSIRVS